MAEGNTMFHLYKNQGKTIESNIKRRVEEFLVLQRVKRHECVDKHRKFDNVVLEYLNLQDDAIEIMMKDMELNTSKKKKKHKFNIMESEYMLEVPEDLESNWLMKCCPEGQRILVVAYNGKTRCFSKRGSGLFSIKTVLPGGYKGPYWNTTMTVLDCVYHDDSGTVFVLDCLTWNSMPMVDCQASFRFSWLENMFNDIPELSVPQRGIKLKLMPTIKLHNVQAVISEPPEDMIPYAGVAFYHIEGFYDYFHGKTPLVGYLESFMIPDVLGISSVHSAHMKNKPNDYTGPEDYIKSKSKKRSRKRRGKTEATPMEEEVEVNDATMSETSEANSSVET